MDYSASRGRVMLLGLLAVLLAGAVLTAGCENSLSREDDGLASAETTPGEFPEAPLPSQKPPPPQLREPQTAVYSYLLWISYAYRVLNSDVASPTFTPDEGIRIDAYVKYGQQEKRAIDQRLLSFTPKKVASKGDRAIVAAREEWVYRYIDITDATYKSPVHWATYDSTYTVVQYKGDWLVHSVEASSVGPPPK